MEKVLHFVHRTNRWHRVGLLFLIVELRLVPLRQYGFTCKDPALSYPFTGDTVSTKWLLATIIIFPLVFLLIAERLLRKDATDNWKRRAIHWYKEYMFGVMLNLTFIGLLKVIVGSPRPHFFDTCQPLEANNCVDSEFVSSYTCTKHGWIHQSDHSFPSGHASLGVHAAFFLVLYLHKHFNRCLSTHAFQIALFTASTICGASRMWDHRHHWWDVLAGSVLAVPILAYTIWFSCNNFEYPHDSLEKSEKENSESG